MSRRPRDSDYVSAECREGREVFPVLTDVWRQSGEGVALVLSAAVDEEAVEGGVALLPVDAVGEAAPLLVAFHPGVEADVSSAGAVHARLLLVLASAQELPVVVGVWGGEKKQVWCLKAKEKRRHTSTFCEIPSTPVNRRQQD